MKRLNPEEAEAVRGFIGSFDRITLRPGDVRRATVTIKYDPVFSVPYWMLFAFVLPDCPRQFVGDA